MQNLIYNRRRFLALSCAALLSTRCTAGSSSSKPETNQLDTAKAPPAPAAKSLMQAAALVKVKEKWTADHLYEFLNALPDESLLSLKKSLELVDENAGLDALQGKSKDVRDIQKQALWISSNILTYPFRDETVLNYHQLATWVAEEVEVKPELIVNEPTFVIERAVQTQLFAQLWDKLTIEQREELLDEINSTTKITDSRGNLIDPNGNLINSNGEPINVAAIGAFSSAGAIAALSATVAFTGFAFYTTMSVAISTVAGFLGLTLPFAAYTGASTVVAFLSGPIGWAIAGLAAVGGFALAGRPNVKKTTAFICQIHALKAAALIEAGTPENQVFG